MKICSRIFLSEDLPKNLKIPGTMFEKNFSRDRKMKLACPNQTNPRGNKNFRIVGQTNKTLEQGVSVVRELDDPYFQGFTKTK